MLLAASSPDVELRFKWMFGGIGVYAAGRMFCSLSNTGLALKYCGEDHPAFLKRKGAKPLRYEPGGPQSNSYVVVPNNVLKDRTVLRSRIARSVKLVKSEPAGKPPLKSGGIKAGEAGFQKA